MHLAIETTGRNGSIALLAGPHVLRQITLDSSQRTASTLAPTLQQLILWSREQGSRIDFVSVADGPGSFTGLRVGVTTAKTLAYAWALPLIGVDSLAAIAATAFYQSDVQSLLVALDAYRNQVFAGEFTRQQLLPALDHIAPDWTAHPPCVEVLQDEQWQDRFAQRAPDIHLAGDNKPFGTFASQTINRDCDAVGVGLLAIRAALQGHWSDPLQMLPRYLKVSAAEEKAESRMGNNHE